jgi:hypothetical protein
VKTKTKILRGVAAMSLSFVFNACADMLSVDAAGDVAMQIQRMSPSLFPAPQGSPSQGRSVQPDTVESFTMVVTSIQFLHSGDSESGTWTTMRLNAPVTLDLMAAPSENQAALTFAAGQVEAGSYSRVRLVVSNPRISFKGDVSFGIGGTLQGGVNYSVDLAGEGSDIEVDASLEVAADSRSSVQLLFNQAATLSSVSVVGSSTVQLAAVIEQR